jgi:hypothetical protein
MRLLGFSEAASLAREGRCRVAGRGLRLHGAFPGPVNGTSCMAGDTSRMSQPGLSSAVGRGSRLGRLCVRSPAAVPPPPRNNSRCRGSQERAWPGRAHLTGPGRMHVTGPGPCT